MPEAECDFYLAATDTYQLTAPMKCWQVKRLRRAAQRFRLGRLGSEIQDDYLLIRTDPPFTIDGKDYDRVLISTKGRSLFPITEWPVFVFVLLTDTDDIEQRDAVRDDEVKVFDWAALFPTEESASQAL